MDSASIQAMFAGLGFAKDALGAALDAKIDAETRQAVSEAMSRLNSAQLTIFEMQTELFKLLEENHALKSQMNQVVAWQDRIKEYELVKTAGGAMVYASKGAPPHFVCPKCIEEKVLHILQDDKSYSGTYTCPNCRASFGIDPERPLPPPKVFSGW